VSCVSPWCVVRFAVVCRAFRRGESADPAR
jgi:hypothetical protein